MSLPVLLVGHEAEALAPRLLLSGYGPLRLSPEGGLQPVPDADPAGDAGPAGGGHAGDPAATPDVPPLPGGSPAPAAVVLSPDEEGRIAALRSRFGSVPILLGLRDDSVEGRSRTLLSGADDFWLTGLGPSHLLTRLRLQLQLSPAISSGPEILQLADLQLIPASRQVSRGGREILLTAREYQLLLLLLEHRGRVLSREQILSRVWRDQQGSASNVIEVYVRYLRQKLEQGGERRLIHTVRGRGYCLSEGPLPPDSG